MTETGDIGGDNSPPNSFTVSALEYIANGLSVIPCGGDSGKKPLISSWKPFQYNQPSEKQVLVWADKFPNANIAIITGKISNITVVDCDDIKELEKVIEIFGDTPLKVRTARGVHLYYRYNGEKSGVNISGLKADIRGNGGYVISPPSTNPLNHHIYAFISGDITCIGQLPKIADNALKPLNKVNKPNLRDGEIIPEGYRNKALFDELRIRARSYYAKKDLKDIAIGINNMMLDPPLQEGEVLRTVDSVWKYKQSGRLRIKGDNYAQLTKEEINALSNDTRAFYLLAFLKEQHYGLRKDFVICSESLSTVLGWGKQTVTDARNALLMKKLIILRYKGGKGKGDVNLYSFP